MHGLADGHMFFKERDVTALRRKPVGGDGAGGAAANDDYVVHAGSLSRAIRRASVGERRSIINEGYRRVFPTAGVRVS
jgi:hypothetical protein